MKMFGDQNGAETRPGNDSDAFVRRLLAVIASATVLIIIAITVFIVWNSVGALTSLDLVKFFTSTEWVPSKDLYGAGSIILGSLLVTAGAMAFAIPVGVSVAIFMSEIASEKQSNYLRPVIELFAGIPSVVYGFFGLMVIVPALANLFPGQVPTGFSWLTGSLLLGMMALPTIISVSMDALKAVPRTYREVSLAMGATRWETTSQVIVPAAVSGIISAVILGLGRAIGETMAVMMVTGNAALVPEPLWNVFSFVRTITATLALEMPEVVVGSLHYSSLFLLGLILMAITLVINLASKRVANAVAGEGSVMSRIPRLSSVLDGRWGPLVREAAMTVAVFAVLYMVCTLFVDTVSSVIIPVAIATLIILLRRSSGGISRIGRQKVMHTYLFFAVALCVLMLVVILGDIVVKALPALSWDFLTQFPSDGGRGGGIYPAIVGTLELIFGTALIALPIGIFSGAYLAEYASRSRFTAIVENSIEVLNGTPSIVFALFGLSAVVTIMGLGISLLAGCITLAFMILPVIVKTTEDAVRNVPRDVREASFALGANKWQTTFKVVLPAALGGIMTGAILGLGRAAGETAPIMFTAAVLMKYKVSLDPLDPVMALPYHLYYLATEGTADPSMQYATALVLLVIVLTMFLVANMIRRRSINSNKW